jgi:hypothetical protein
MSGSIAWLPRLLQIEAVDRQCRLQRLLQPLAVQDGPLESGKQLAVRPVGVRVVVPSAVPNITVLGGDLPLMSASGI